MTPAQYFALCAIVCMVPSLNARWQWLLATGYVTISIAYQLEYFK